jgi:hypothetical protein
MFSMDSASEVYRNHLLTCYYPYCLKLTRHVTEVGKQCPRDAGEAVLVQAKAAQAS